MMPMPKGVLRSCLRYSALPEKRGDLRGAIDAVKGYIAAGNPDNDGEQRLAGLESKIS